MFEERVDLSNDMTWRQMIGVGVRNVVLARGELDRLEGPGYAARRTELRRKAKEAARTRDRQAAAPQDEAEENVATEEEVWLILRPVWPRLLHRRGRHHQRHDSVDHHGSSNVYATMDKSCTLYVSHHPGAWRVRAQPQSSRKI